MNIFPVANLEQRKQFYEQEFRDGCSSFFSEKPQFFVFEYGTSSRIMKHPSSQGLQVLPPMSYELLRLRLINECPELVYYDRNRYADPFAAMQCENFPYCFVRDDKHVLGQQLAFSIPAKNLCSSCRFGSAFHVCPSCVQLSLNNAFAIRDLLTRNFSHVRVISSGFASDVHVFDPDAFSLSVNERAWLVEEMRMFKIDASVTIGKNRLSLLPFSLHGGASRKVLPVSKILDPVSAEELLPSFLKMTPIS